MIYRIISHLKALLNSDLGGLKTFVKKKYQQQSTGSYCRMVELAVFLQVCRTDASPSQPSLIRLLLSSLPEFAACQKHLQYIKHSHVRAL